LQILRVHADDLAKKQWRGPHNVRIRAVNNYTRQV
jgi:hypothetical protein